MTILYSILVLSLLGIIAGVSLFFVAKKFNVIENPLIDEVEAMLPGANCGGCGFPGCRKFADVLVNSESIEGLFCSPAGQEQMEKIAEHLGKSVSKKAMQVAVVRCNGSCDVRPVTNEYEGISSCAFAAQLYAGETACSFGCLGLGDCELVCAFDAIHVNVITGLPEVITDKCTACGACVDACPKQIIELRKTNKKDLKIYVSCVNKDKGVVAKKACDVACIGCGKCVKVCPHSAITLQNSLAYIDDELCKLCRKCVDECPTHAIIETNFPEKKKQVQENSSDIE
ncbi:MAG TPA: RnfABCDGE type electron transport complex subunit B [Bacteroidales bacterium]|jgi:Na+-translocating ferredoxin:NAD+ oxidoreductase RNF subunit RnfB|nr:RnfABCDGE type electron transport complex subunit B [Bacteroidales bacterium]